MRPIHNHPNGIPDERKKQHGNPEIAEATKNGRDKCQSDLRSDVEHKTDSAEAIHQNYPNHLYPEEEKISGGNISHGEHHIEIIFFDLITKPLKWQIKLFEVLHKTIYKSLIHFGRSNRAEDSGDYPVRGIQQAQEADDFEELRVDRFQKIELN